MGVVPDGRARKSLPYIDCLNLDYTSVETALTPYA